jgi:hypothetical protein
MPGRIESQTALVNFIPIKIQRGFAFAVIGSFGNVPRVGRDECTATAPATAQFASVYLSQRAALEEIEWTTNSYSEAA